MARSPGVTVEPMRPTPTGPRPTACIRCQKQKVRCRQEGGKPPCLRCQRRRVSCTFRKHTLPRDDNTDLGAALVSDLRMVHDALNEMRCAKGKPLLPPLQSVQPSTEHMGSRAPVSPERNDSDLDNDILVEQEPQNLTVEAEIDRTPIRSLYQITRLKSLRSQRIAPPSNTLSRAHPLQKDVISVAVLQYEDASRLVQLYLSRSNHYLYDIAGKYEDLDSIRSASPLLLVAVCAVGALQDTSSDRLYRTLHRELRKLILDFVFKPSMDLEDLRGLVVASFGISDISWSVSGLAIRRALEVDLQDAFGAVRTLTSSDGDPNHDGTGTQDLEIALERMKLWYLLYICDQHLSILYARTPMLGDQESIRNFESYLNAMPDPVCSQRIMSQVSLLRILRTTSDLFGVDRNERIPTVFRQQLDSFNTEIDAWAGKWLSCYSNHPVVGDYPSKAVSLHYHFAKLVVCAYVFRGRTRDPTPDAIPLEFRSTARTAVQSALSIIDLTIGDSDLTVALAGLPHYFHSMMAYACAFLIKTVMFHRKHVDDSVEPARDKIAKVIQLCNATECGQHHLVRWIGKGLQALLYRGFEAAHEGDNSSGPREASQPYVPSETSALYPTSADQPHVFGESGRGPDAARSATFTRSSDSMHELGGILQNELPPMDQQFDTIPYSAEEIDDNFFLSAEAQAHMNHFGLGLGLLK